MEVRRIDPAKGFLNEIRNINKKVTALETKPSGNIVIRETLSAEDPETGVTTILGQLPDGSIGFQPFIGDVTPPPVATPPTVSAEPGTFVVSWDGAFFAGATQPRDFEQVNVIGRVYQTTTVHHVGIIRKSGEPAFVSTDVARPGTTWEFALESEDYNGNKAQLSLWSAPLTMIDAISSVDVAWTDMQEEVAAAKELSVEAQESASTAQAAAEKAAQDALKASGLVAGKGRVLFQNAAPEGDDKTNTLWIDTTNNANTPKRWDGAKWVAVTDKVAVEAAAAALAAETLASQAFNAAEQAANNAGEALTAANGKSRNWYTPKQPTGTDHKEGDTWYDTANGNRIKVWSGGKWNDSVDKAVTDAAKVADEAKASANGKNTNTYSVDAPTLAQGAGRVSGDTWFREDTAGKIYASWTWNGSAWVAKKYRHEVIDSVDAAKISTGTLDALRIGARSISVDKLLVSSTDNLVSDADFRDPKGVSWGGYAGAYVWDETGGRNGAPALKIVNTALQQGKYNLPDLPTTQGNAYRVGAWIKSSVEIPIAGVALYCRQKTLKGSTYTASHVTTNDAPLAPNVWHYLSKIHTTVADATTMSFGVYTQVGFATGELWVDYVSATRASNGSLIVDGSVTADSIASGQVNAGHIAAGSVNATHIGAKAITADKLVITSSDNLIIEPDFSNNGFSWNKNNFVTVNATAGRNGLPALRVTGSTAVQTSFNLLNKIPVDQDDRFRVKFWTKTSVAQAINSISVHIRCYTSATVYSDMVAVANTEATPIGAWRTYEAISPTMPAGTTAVEFFIRVANTTAAAITDIDSLSVTRASNGKLIVDGSVTAKKLETDLILTTKIIAGDPTGVRAEMAPEGFKVFGKASGDTTSTGTYEIVRLGVADTNDMFAIADKDGITQASISETGVVSGKQVYASQDIVFKGQALSDILWSMPRGHIASAFRTTHSANNAKPGGEWAPYMRLEVNVERNRLYKISTSPLKYGQDAGGSASIRIVQSTGSVANIGSVTIDNIEIESGVDGNSAMLSEYTQIGGATVDGPSGDVVMVSYLLMFKAHRGQFGMRASGISPARLMIEDMGPLRNAYTGIHLDTTATNGVPPAAPPAKSTHTSTWDCNWIRSFDGNGNIYNYNNARGYQGLSPAGYGNMKTVMKFPDMTGTLSGSIIHEIKVYLYFEHWYYNAGGTARIGLAGTGDPTTYGGQNPIVSSGGWPKPGGRWVTIPTQHYYGFQTGANRGITLEGDGTYGTYGIAHPGKIEITYTK